MSLPPSRFPNADSPLFGYFYSMVEQGILRIFIEYRIFDAIPDEGTTLPELAEKTGVDPKLLERFTNFLIPAEVLKSSAPGRIEPTAFSKLFQTPLANHFYPHIYDYFVGVSVKWPEYFSQNGRREPQQSNRSPFGFAVGQPDKTFYEVLEKDPRRTKTFNDAMSYRLDQMPIVGIYDFKWIGEYFASPTAKADRASIVDVGGGKGQALKAILEENTGIPPASAVLEDQAKVIEQAKAEAAGVLKPAKMIPHSFFDEQPVKGAFVYYIRRVLNDWSDSEVVQILSKTRAACAPDSRILIHENLLPDKPDLGIAAIDLLMLNLAGKRRNEKIFTELASKAGLKVTSVSIDKRDNTNSGVIEMRPV